METKNKIEELKFVIGRYDHYFDSVNNKGNLYLTINTFILGGGIAGYISLDNQFHFGCGALLLFVFALLSNLFSICFTLAAIKPYLNTKQDNSNGSIIFFGDVADYHSNQFEKLWDEIDETKLFADIKKQTQLLAIGLRDKFNYLGYATWFIGTQVISIIIFGIIILNK